MTSPSLLLTFALLAQDGDEPFEKRIRPTLIKECVSCHGPKEAKNGLRVDSRERLLKGGEAGPAIKPGDPDASLLVKALRGTDADLKMPPKKRLPKDVVDDFARWVKAGAPWPASAAFTDVHAGKDHWAFQPLRKAPPATVDSFILAPLEKKGLQAVEPADKRTLLRRATFDLIGLPPTRDEIREFLADASPEAFRKVVDRLLASPHYGERWGRYWLDVVRYADTAGNAPDFPVPQAWRYRNYVIRAFNQDKPYDEFLREQIAGDLLSPRARAEVVAFCVEAAGVLREVAAARAGVPAPVRTTEELLAVTPSRNLAAALRACDLAKFARAEPDAAARRALLDAGEAFVRERAP